MSKQGTTSPDQEEEMLKFPVGTRCKTVVGQHVLVTDQSTKLEAEVKLFYNQEYVLKKPWDELEALELPSKPNHHSDVEIRQYMLEHYEEFKNMLCPIGLCPLTQPVRAADGCVYEKKWLDAWIKEHNGKPLVSPCKTMYQSDESALLVLRPMDKTYHETTLMNNLVKSRMYELRRSDLKPVTSPSNTGCISSLNLIFSALDPVFDVCESLKIGTFDSNKLPYITAIGGEKEGKSTLLNALLGMCIFPQTTEHGICTRLPIRVQVRHCLDPKPPSAVVWDTLANQATIHKIDVLSCSSACIQLRQLMQLALSGYETAESVAPHREIRVWLESTSLPSINILDLPGLVNNPPQREKITYQLMNKHLTSEANNTMILAVVPARNSLATSTGLSTIFSQGLSKHSVCVITHTDLAVHKRTDQVDLLKKLENDHSRALKPYGYVATSLPDIDATTSLLDTLMQKKRQEQELFQNCNNFMGQDLLRQQKASCTYLMERLGAMYRSFMQKTYIPEAINGLSKVRHSTLIKICELGVPFLSNSQFAQHPQIMATPDKLCKLVSTTLFAIDQDIQTALHPLLCKCMQFPPKKQTEYKLLYAGEVQSFLAMVRQEFVDFVIGHCRNITFDDWVQMVTEKLTSNNKGPLKLQRFGKLIQQMQNLYKTHAPTVNMEKLKTNLHKKIEQCVNLSSVFVTWEQKLNDDGIHMYSISIADSRIMAYIETVALDAVEFKVSHRDNIPALVQQNISCDTTSLPRHFHIKDLAAIEEAMLKLICAGKGLKLPSRKLSPFEVKYNLLASGKIPDALKMDELDNLDQFKMENEEGFFRLG